MCHGPSRTPVPTNCNLPYEKERKPCRFLLHFLIHIRPAPSLALLDQPHGAKHREGGIDSKSAKILPKIINGRNATLISIAIGLNCAELNEIIQSSSYPIFENSKHQLILLFHK